MKTIILIINTFILLFFFACSENNATNSDEPITYTKLSAGFDKATKIEIFVKKTPVVGYNKFYISISDSLTNERIDDARITFAPLMDMGTMMHACPFENPVSNKAVDGLFPGALTFIMSGMWQLDVNFNRNDTGTEGTVHFMFEVEASSLVKNVDGNDGKKYFVTLIQPEKWQVGTTPIEFCINSRATMMNFPPEEKLSISMEPWMDMGEGQGHGSSENINPAHMEKGHYKGQIHYTMTGSWDINLSINKGDSLLVETTFEVTVE